MTTSEAVERRRRAMLAAATDLFGRKGWPVATADEVALQAGVTKRTLYSYFGTKQGLLYEVGKALIDVSRERFNELVALRGSPTERMAAVVVGYAELVVIFHTEYLVFLEEMKHLDDFQLAHVTEISAEWVALVTDIIEEGQRIGEFARGYDAAIVAFTILGMLNGIVYWVDIEERSESTVNRADQLVELIFEGLSIIPRS
ncbi:TetR/AcrR family transcriptional regulator [Mycobacterium sp. 1274756.6]|uniref:TetR/AcrR family transcriptional regulator n=1 Tax=Mycobacterium sp. 1274756.6 TaxID=1834076 RepID=UPI0008006A3B|nr:TetR/AcrR family transcriptional regulator [Mycobacterium sp. 1274756.6]OBJ67836.1 hypothetical protein A5643_15150 [Mycobacterium sp. 1274756.6]